MLQTRNGKRTGAAMVRIAMEMLEGDRLMKNRAGAGQPGTPGMTLLHPVFDPAKHSRRRA